MYKVDFTTGFKKDMKRCQKRGLPMAELRKVIELLAHNGKLPQQYRPHILSGKLAGTWECHIKDNIADLQSKICWYQGNVVNLWSK